MYYRRKVVLAILETSPNFSREKVALQNLIFKFCLKKDKAKFYDFIDCEFFSNPFSFLLDKDLELLSAHYKLIEEKNGYWSLIKNENFFKSLTKEDKELVGKLNNVSNYLQNTPKKNDKDKALFSMGYEGISVDTYFNKLLNKGINLIVDVRKNAFSRKYGFSKKELKKICDRLKISYLHFDYLGIDSSKRKNLATDEDYKKVFASYKENFPTEKAKNDLLELFKKYSRIMLTCFEKDHNYCHRSIIIELLKKEFSCEIVHL